MKRLQFQVSDKMAAQLDALVEETGLKTMSQLLNTALTFYEWAIQERKEGRVIASVNEKTERFKEIEMPGFPRVKKTATFTGAVQVDRMALNGAAASDAKRVRRPKEKSLYHTLLSSKEGEPLSTKADPPGSGNSAD